MVEFCHGLEPVMQPSPCRNPGGDCFACSLTAAMRHLFPEEPPKFDQVWDAFRCCYYGETEKRALSNTWPGMAKALHELRYGDGEQWPIEHRIDRVIPTYEVERWAYHWGAAINSEDYVYRLEGWLRSGWIALTEVELHASGRGGWRPDGYRQTTNHFVAIDGVRYGRIEYAEGEGGPAYRMEVRVVCSVKGAYWIGTTELLERHGAAAWHLVRRDFR